ncbi:MAG: hypothetical protein K6F99_03145 [Lachnospiraceae bacterium]|nr:hypothetical protein [Lachnospiraceae bacterium]
MAEQAGDLFQYKDKKKKKAINESEGESHSERMMAENPYSMAHKSAVNSQMSDNPYANANLNRQKNPFAETHKEKSGKNTLNSNAYRFMEPLKNSMVKLNSLMETRIEMGDREGSVETLKLHYSRAMENADTYLAGVNAVSEKDKNEKKLVSTVKKNLEKEFELIDKGAESFWKKRGETGEGMYKELVEEIREISKLPEEEQNAVKKGKKKPEIKDDPNPAQDIGDSNWDDSGALGGDDDSLF